MAQESGEEREVCESNLTRQGLTVIGRLARMQAEKSTDRGRRRSLEELAAAAELAATWLDDGGEQDDATRRMPALQSARADELVAALETRECVDRISVGPNAVSLKAEGPCTILIVRD